MFSDTVVSSTYFHMSKILGTVKSLIIKRKSQGPNFVPCGTPDGTVPHSETQSFPSLTLWDLPERKSITQLITLLGILTCFSLLTKILWSMRSKAFDNQRGGHAQKHRYHPLLRATYESYWWVPTPLKNQIWYQIGWSQLGSLGQVLCNQKQ